MLICQAAEIKEGLFGQEEFSSIDGKIKDYTFKQENRKDIGGNMKDIEKIAFSYDVTLKMKMEIPEKDMERIIKREMAHGIGNCIVNNLDKLPVLHEAIEIVEIPATEHKISFYMISAEELKRLKEMEKYYFSMHGREDT
jgi:hypothetical protein